MEKIELKKRLTKKELQDLYGVDRFTLDSWIKTRGLPIIRVSSHSKYIRLEDLIEWENSLIGNK
jgi:hypothetical protein